MQYENTECSRCGGTGKFSYNLKDGDTCYGCGGRKVTLTERGQAARKFYEDSLRVAANEVKVGWYIFDSIYSKWNKVTEINDDPLNFCMVDGVKRQNIIFTTAKHRSAYPYDAIVKAVEGNDSIKEKMAEALAHQDTLKVDGKPKKKAS